MSELTVLDPIEKLFANTRGQICDKFRVNKLKRKLRIIGDITSLTEEQFVGSFGSDYADVSSETVYGRTEWIFDRWRIPPCIVREWMTPISVFDCIRLAWVPWSS